MDPRLIGYNRRRRQQQMSRRWQHQEALILALGHYGAMTALAKKLGVHKSTISRDSRALWRAYWQRRNGGCPAREHESEGLAGVPGVAEPKM
jgi:hypothetical protein